MPDPDREIALEANGNHYRLYYGNRAFRMAERESGESFIKLMSSFDVTDPKEIRWENLTLLVWAGLQQYHPELSMDDVDDIIDGVGTSEIMPIVTTAFNKAFPQAQEDQAQGNGNRATRRAKNGTGPSSSPALSQPASVMTSSGP